MGKNSKKRTCSGFVMVNENIEVLVSVFYSGFYSLSLKIVERSLVQAV